MEMRKIVALILIVISGITGIVSGILIAYNKLMYEISMLRAEFENYKKGMGVLIDTSINERLEWCHDNINEHYKILDGIKNSLKLDKEKIERLEKEELKREIKEHTVPLDEALTWDY